MVEQLTQEQKKERENFIIWLSKRIKSDYYIKNLDDLNNIIHIKFNLAPVFGSTLEHKKMVLDLLKTKLFDFNKSNSNGGPHAALNKLIEFKEKELSGNLLDLSDFQKNILNNLNTDKFNSKNYKTRIELREKLKFDFENKIKTFKEFKSFIALNKLNYGYGATITDKNLTETSFNNLKSDYQNNAWDDTKMTSWYTFPRFLKNETPISYKLDREVLKILKVPINYSSLQLVYSYIQKIYNCDYSMAMEYIWNTFNKTEQSEDNTHDNSILLSNHPLLEKKKQVILYGPAGTGKTFGIKYEIEKHLDETILELNKFERFNFLTFHQSFAYEEFIEGIKPVEKDNQEIGYEVQNGIFKSFCDKIILNSINSSKLFQKEINTLNESYEKLLNEIKKNKDGQLELETKTGSKFKVSINSKNNLNLHTGSNFTKQGVLTKENIFKEINGEPKFDGWKSYFDTIANKIKFNLTSDELFDDINEINTLSRFYNLSKEQKNKLFENAKPYYLVIDEINRGNISKIFGELITLLESSKRLGEKDELIVKLPYSKEKFGIPPNLYIIGTMNTSDKSLTSLDVALRRRFGFIKMLPKYDLDDLCKELEGYNIPNLLKGLNYRIKYLLDEDHMIGHSYFMGENLDLKEIFNNEIIPLLEEYFYGEIEKFELVLGKNFTSTTELNNLVFERNDFNGDEIKSIKYVDDIINFKKSLTKLCELGENLDTDLLLKKVKTENSEISNDE